MTRLERYIFRSHPGCCEKCDEMNHETRRSEPEYDKAHPNCKCPGWKKELVKRALVKKYKRERKNSK